MKETPTQSSAALDRQLHAVMRRSSHDSDQDSKSASVTDVESGASNANDVPDVSSTALLPASRYIQI